jgi:hypothetical protein
MEPRGRRQVSHPLSGGRPRSVCRDRKITRLAGGYQEPLILASLKDKAAGSHSFIHPIQRGQSSALPRRFHYRIRSNILNHLRPIDATLCRLFVTVVVAGTPFLTPPAELAKRPCGTHDLLSMGRVPGCQRFPAGFFQLLNLFPERYQRRPKRV